MLPWLQNNAGTLAVGAVVAAILIALTVKLIRDRRQGKSSCGCGCSECALKNQCHGKTDDTASKSDAPKEQP